MPDAPELAALIIDLQNTANEAGVEWDTLAPGRPADVAGGYQMMTLAFSVAGTWDDCMDYLRRLSELERAVRVRQVDVTPDVHGSALSTAAPEATPKVRTSLTLEVYSMARGAAPGAPGAPAPAAQ